MLSKKVAHQARVRFKLLRLGYPLQVFHQVDGKRKREVELGELKLEE